MCLCLAIKSVSAFTCFACVVAVVFGSVMVTENEATQKCFCELSAPHSPVVKSRRKVGSSPSRSIEGHLQLSCYGPFRRARPGHGGAALEPYPPGPLILPQRVLLMVGLFVHVKGSLNMPAFIALFGSFLPCSPLWPV